MYTLTGADPGYEGEKTILKKGVGEGGLQTKIVPFLSRKGGLQKASRMTILFQMFNKMGS